MPLQSQYLLGEDACGANVWPTWGWLWGEQASACARVQDARELLVVQLVALLQYATCGNPSQSLHIS